MFKLTRELGGILSVSISLASLATIVSAGEGGGRIGELEVIRRQAAVGEANDAYLRGRRAGAQRDIDTAAKEIRAALDTLPYAANTEEHRRIYLQAYSEYGLPYARRIAEKGRLEDAREIVSYILQEQPDNPKALKTLDGLNDPDRYVNDPAHADRTESVNRLLKEAHGSSDLAKWDEATNKYNEVLRLDRYNAAARRGLESIANEKRRHYEVAYRQTRATALRQVDQTWERPVPEAPGEGAGNLASFDSSDAGLGYITTKLESIRIPEIRLSGTNLRDAVNFLRQRAREYDTVEPNEARKGVNINIDEGAIQRASSDALTKNDITLDLTGQTLAQAIQYLCQFTGTKYKVDPFSVVIVAANAKEDTLYTKVWPVPPYFLGLDSAGAGSATAAPTGGNPFDDPGAAAPAPTLGAKKSAREILEGRGVKFLEGATAFYSPSSSQLYVRNTPSNLEAVDEIVRSLMIEGVVPRQVKVESKFVEIRQENLKELGFDWIMGGFGLGSGDRIMAGGGSIGGSLREFDSVQFPFFGQGGSIPANNSLNPITAGLRSGSEAINQSAIESLVAAGRVGAISDKLSPAPGALSIAGILTDPQFQVIMRALDQRKGIDLMSAPSILTRNGQQAEIQVVRELIYPTAYDPPEVPQQVVVDQNGGGAPAPTAPPAITINSLPVTPATPSEFATRNTGVVMKVTPTVLPDGTNIELEIVPEVVEFEGFVNYGSPIISTVVDLLGIPTQIILTDNRIEQPVFSTRRATTNVVIMDGQTVAIGGLIREDVQHTNDKLPIFGDLPVVGRFFRSEAEETKKRNLTIFVTAQLIDPAGRPLRSPPVEEEVEEADSSLFPSEPVRGYGTK